METSDAITGLTALSAFVKNSHVHRPRVRGVRARTREFQSYLSLKHTSLSEVLEQQLAPSHSLLTVDITTRIRILNSRFALEHRYIQKSFGDASIKGV